MLQEREATLHGIREGVIAFDRPTASPSSTTRPNACSASRPVPIGSRQRELLPPGPAARCARRNRHGQDDVVVTDDYCLAVNRMPVTLGGKSHGAVATLRDRTEITGLRASSTANAG